MDRLKHEREHGIKILAHAEEVWGWTSPAGSLRAERRAKYLYQLGKFKPNDLILEIGCGTGLFTEKVYNATKAHIIAIDLSEELLAQARQRPHCADFKMEDAMEMTFAEQAFDGVFGSSILHHLDMEKALTEIYRVLKPGGRMVFAEPNMLNPQIAIQKNVPAIKRALGDSPDETAVVRWSFKAQMEKIGFKNVLIFPYDFLHPSTPKPLIPIVSMIGGIVEKIPLLKEIAGSVIIYGER